MKTRNKFLLIIPALLFTLLLALAGCEFGNGENGGNREPGTRGSVTFIGLPSGTVISMLEVSREPNIQWTAAGQGISVNRPVSDIWRHNQIGSGLQPVGNVVAIRTAEYERINGVWIERGDENWWRDFLHTGAASIYMQMNITGLGWIAIGLNNVLFNNGHAVFDITTALIPPFTLPPTEGRLTLTDAEEFNGKWAFVLGTATGGDNITPVGTIYGIGGAESLTALKGFQISNGKAEIPLYYLSINPVSTNFAAYTRSETPFTLVVYIMNNETTNFADLITTGGFAGAAYIVYMNVETMNSGIAFSNGRATVSIDHPNATIWRP